MSDDEVFDPPIELNLNNNPGPVLFRRRKELEDWLAAERDAWQTFPFTQVHQSFRSVAELQRSTPDEISDYCAKYFSGPADQRNDLWRRILSRLERYQRHEVAHHRTPWGRLVLRLLAYDPTEATAAIWGHAQVARELEGREPRDWIGKNNFPHVSALAIQGIVRSLVVSGAALPDGRDHIEALATIRTELEKTNASLQEHSLSARAEWKEVKATQGEAFRKHLEDTTTKTDAQIAATMATTDAQIAEATAKIQKLEALFNEKIRLEAPVQYWRDKQQGHRVGVVVWGSLLALVSLGPLVALGIFAGAAYKWFHAEQSGLTTAGLAMLLAVAVLYLAFGRLIARLFSTSLALRDDASERVVMAQTFLALVQDAKLSEDDRKLVLASLFRPHASAPDGDGVSGLTDLIAKSMSPQKH